jgi:hypothetical protein
MADCITSNARTVSKDAKLFATASSVWARSAEGSAFNASFSASVRSSAARIRSCRASDARAEVTSTASLLFLSSIR